jgi:hypothetical protein
VQWSPLPAAVGSRREGEARQYGKAEAEDTNGHADFLPFGNYEVKT